MQKRLKKKSTGNIVKEIMYEIECELENREEEITCWEMEQFELDMEVVEEQIKEKITFLTNN